MAGFQGGDDAFQLGAELEHFHRLIIRRGDVFGALGIVQEGVFRADAGIVQTGGDGMSVDDLPVIILQEIGLVAVEDARLAAFQRGGVLTGFDAVAGRLDADQAHFLILDEGMEEAHRIGPTTDTGDAGIGQAAQAFLHLGAGFAADDGLEIADHGRIGVRAGDRADDVEGVLHIRHPVAQGLIHGVLQRTRAGGDRDDFRAQQFHAEHVRGLAFHIGGAHEDGAGNAEPGRHGGGGHAVLAGAGLGDDPGLAHALGQKDLAEAVIDLVAARMVQLVALEPDLRAAEFLGQAFREIDRAGLADIILQEEIHLGPEVRILLGRLIGFLEFQNVRHQCFGDETTAIIAKPALLVRPGRERIRACIGGHGFAHGTLLLTA